MSYERAINMMLDVFVRDGNVLLNVGPDRDGVIPASHAERLREIGKWMAEHADSIYGTRGGPFQPTEYYGSTYKDNKIYLHVRKWPEKGTLILAAIPPTIRSFSILNEGKISGRQNEKEISIEVPPVDRRLLDTVVVFELNEPIAGILDP